MKRARIIVVGVIFLSAFAFASCGSRPAKEAEKVEEASCCAKKDSTKCEMKDSTKCEKKEASCCAKKDSTATK